jgi:hypothetical protein
MAAKTDIMKANKRVQHPSFLYRAFRERQHARDFVDYGRFRLGLIEGYKTVEDRGRQDSREGESSSFIETNVSEVEVDKSSMRVVAVNSVPGRLHLRGRHLNPLYLLCAAGPSVDLTHLRRQFGEWVVRIDAPSRLLLDLHSRDPVNSSMEICGKPKLERVSYSKDEIGVDYPDSFESTRLCWTQKPKDFEPDCEYRYIITAKLVIHRSPDPYLYYDFCTPIAYAEHI